MAERVHHLHDRVDARFVEVVARAPADVLVVPSDERELDPVRRVTAGTRAARAVVPPGLEALGDAAIDLRLGERRLGIERGPAARIASVGGAEDRLGILRHGRRRVGRAVIDRSHAGVPRGGRITRGGEDERTRSESDEAKHGPWLHRAKTDESAPHGEYESGCERAPTGRSAAANQGRRAVDVFQASARVLLLSTVRFAGPQPYLPAFRTDFELAAVIDCP